MTIKKYLPPALALCSVIALIGSVTPALAQLKQGMDTKANCASLTFLPQEDLDVTSDPDTGLVTVGHVVNGKQVQTVLNYQSKDGFKGCSEDAKDLLTRVKQYADKTDADTCAEFIDIVAGKKATPDLDGVKLNIDKVKQYIKKLCQK